MGMKIDRMAKLEEFVLTKCICACCEADKDCDPDCTFQNDCPEEFKEMQEARKVYWEV